MRLAGRQPNQREEAAEMPVIYLYAEIAKWAIQSYDIDPGDDLMMNLTDAAPIIALILN